MKLEALLGKALNGKAINKSKPISLQQLRQQAAKLGLTIEIDRVGRDIGYWINGTDWTDDRYCSDKLELQYKLEQLAQ